MTNKIEGTFINAEFKPIARLLLQLGEQFNNISYFIVIYFMHFFTDDIQSNDNKPIFRLRQQILSEIQSKLARHISRHSILFYK